MTTTCEKLEFDPGFGQYLLAFKGMVEYLYLDINRFKNLSQKKLKFKQYYKKILIGLNNNVGFYAGCLLWAAYLKTKPEQEISSNYCLGQPYDPDENISETRYMLKFVELFPKDVKYYLSETFEFDEKIIKIIKLYEEFLVLNKGFTETKLTDDLKLPETFNPENPESFKELIDNILSTGKLEEFLNHIEV